MSCNFRCWILSEIWFRPDTAPCPLGGPKWIQRKRPHTTWPCTPTRYGPTVVVFGWCYCPRAVAVPVEGPLWEEPTLYDWGRRGWRVRGAPEEQRVGSNAVLERSREKSHVCAQCQSFASNWRLCSGWRCNISFVQYKWIPHFWYLFGIFVRCMVFIYILIKI